MLELHKSLVVAEAQSGKVVKLGCITRLPGQPLESSALSTLAP